MPMVLPNSQKYVLAAGVAKIIPGQDTPMSVHVPTGTTALVQTTLASPEEVEAEISGGPMVDWVDWPQGTVAGPVMDTLLYKVTAVKLKSVAGGPVYVTR